MLKNWYHGSTVILMVILLAGCSAPDGKTGLEENDEPVSEIQKKETQEQGKEMAAVSIWDQVSVRETPDQKGKWLTSLSIGESLVFLGDRETDATDDNKEYMKIRLNDGKEGWTRSDFIVPEAQPGVFTQETYLYKRPDLLTKSDHAFSSMDIIAIMEVQDDWIKVRGKRSKGKWIDEGWVKISNLSSEAVDIATAKFAKKALENEEKKIASIEDIINNSDLKTSVFIPELQKMISAAEAENPTEEMISEYIPETDSIQ